MRSLLWIVIIIIIYGSLFPFNFVWVDPADIAWLDWGFQLKQRTTNGDVLSNFLTFLPVGYIGYMLNPPASLLDFKKIAKVIVLGGLFAYCMQIAQFFLPSRVPTVGDAWINLWGIIIGLLAAVGVRYYLRRNPQIALEWPSVISVPILMVAFWILFQLFPFIPEFNLSNFNRALSALWQRPNWLWSEWLFLSVMWYCFFGFLRSNHWFRATYSQLAVMIAAIFMAQILIAYKDLSLTNLLAAAGALLLFWKFPVDRWNRWHCLAIGLAIFIREIYPFNIKADSYNFNWIPFSYYLKGSMWVNTQSFLEKVFAYGTLIFCVTEWITNRLKAIIYCLGFILLIEILQLMVSYRSADITDLLMIAIIGYTFHQFKPVKLI